MVNILIVNCGSSSLGFKVYQGNKPEELPIIISGKARNVATSTKGKPVLEWTSAGQKFLKAYDMPDHCIAAQAVLEVLSSEKVSIDAVGHRFVHGGERFKHSVLINDQVLTDLKQCLPLAPIHNPNSYSVIALLSRLMPGIPQFAVFDTAFHAALPMEARSYAIPRDLADKYGLRKFGFHGLSCQYVSEKAAQYIGKPIDRAKLVLCHLGTGGSSVTAFRDGHSVDTSMGFSPLAGLVMSTRCGDIDGEVVLELMRKGYSVEEVSRILNQESGLIGLSGFSSNLNEVIKAAEEGNENCLLAYEVYANRLKFYLGAYTWLLDGADAIVFTDDVGIGSWKLREKVLSQEENLGIYLDSEKNRNAQGDITTDISRPDSRTRLLVIPTDEELVILKEVLNLINPT